MPGEGFTFDMISHLKRNNSYLKRRRYFDVKQEISKISEQLRIMDPKKATPEQLQQIRSHYTARRKKAIVKRFLAMILAIGMTVILIYGFIYWMRMVFVF